MLVLINAFKSICRAKGRNILIGIIVLTIAIASCVALAIKNAAGAAENAGLDSVNITASISVDRQKIMQSVSSSNTSGTNGGAAVNRQDMANLMSQYPDLTLDQLQTYADSSYVKDFYYSDSLSLNASGDLQPVSTNGSTGNNSSSNQNRQGGRVMFQNGSVGGVMNLGDFTITGYSSENAMTNFMSGTSKVTTGSIFDVTSSDLNCIISNDLATYNNLSVGDKITLSNPNSDTETYVFTITGIFTNSSTSNNNFPSFMDPANSIYTSYGAINNIITNSASVATTTTNAQGDDVSTALTGNLSSTFTFSSKSDYDSFVSEVKTKGLSDYYTVSSTDVNNYEQSLVPLQNLSSFATTMLWVVLAVGAVILIVINIFNIRERKYEVGVLTAIGIKKGKVAMQFVTELLAVTLLAILVGTAAGAAISVPVANSMLASQNASEQASTTTQQQNFGRGGQMGGPGPTSIQIGRTAGVNYLNQINATVSFTILAELIGIGLILTILSSLVAVVFILRYEPLKILANRA